MFKGLHNALHKAKPVTVSQVKHPDATPIQSAEVLLAPEKRQKHLRTIKSLLNLPPKLYDSLYYRVIEQFAEFTQNLPETQYGMFAHEGGFIDHGLERAARALSLCLQYFFPQEKSLQNITAQEALWIYAVFTAALVLDISKIAVKYKVDLCNRDGTVIKEWLPFNGTMNKNGKFYRFSFVKENRDNLKRLISGLLARQILDANSTDEQGTGTGGFSWIASNNDVLETWLMILQGEKRLPMGSYLSVIPIADAQIIEAYFAGKIIAPGTQPFINSLFDNSQNANQGQDYKTTPDMGQDFLKWVRESIANGKLSINQNTPNSDIHIVEEGALLNPDLFEKFIRDQSMSGSTDPHSIEQQFRQSLEVYWDSPGNIQHRYTAIQGISSMDLKRYILVARLDILFPADAQLDINPRLNQRPLQVANLPISPQRAVQPGPSPTLNF